MYEIVATIRDKVIEMEVEYERMKVELSNVDKSIKDLYHLLEIDKLNAIEITTIASELRKNLRLRRKLKEDIMPYRNFMSDPRLEKLLVSWLSVSDGKKSKERLARYDAEARESRKRIFG